MDPRSRPYRSVLYIPGSKERALDKARGLAADAIIFDLEDAVTPAEKESARGLLARKLCEADYGRRARVLRINDFDTPWGEADLTALAPARPDAVLLPKVGGKTDIEALARRMDALPGYEDSVIWAMMETAEGVLNAREIAKGPRMGGFVLGTNDLAKELNCRNRADRLPLLSSLQICLLAARAGGLLCIDGVYNAFSDTDGLAAECAQGRDMGFDGKTLIHPSQLAPCNAIFAPDGDEIAHARDVVAAFDDPANAGQGVLKVNGKMTELLHLDIARQKLAIADAIAARSPEVTNEAR